MGTDTNDQDKQLFRQAVAAIQHIDPKYGDAMPMDHGAMADNTDTEHDTASALYASHTRPSDEDKIGAEDKLFYSTAGIQQQQLKRLKQGRLTIEARLDLHGHTVEQCHAALAHFIAHCQQQACRTVLIIHGKGNSQYAILKSALNQTLRHHPAILAFCSAKAQHGGSGAMYVLLKSIKPREHTP